VVPDERTIGDMRLFKFGNPLSNGNPNLRLPINFGPDVEIEKPKVDDRRVVPDEIAVDPIDKGVVPDERTISDMKLFKFGKPSSNGNPNLRLPSNFGRPSPPNVEIENPKIEADEIVVDPDDKSVDPDDKGVNPDDRGVDPDDRGVDPDDGPPVTNYIEKPKVPRVNPIPARFRFLTQDLSFGPPKRLTNRKPLRNKIAKIGKRGKKTQPRRRKW
ncbi:unnamed protein product, partial [Owenia fusiformis]